MAAQDELLKAKIEQAKQDLARDLADLRQEGSATARKLATALAALAAIYAAFRLVRFLRRRGS
jgi:hypothetical protein